MKKNFSKYLHPPFMRRLDEYLLVNYPTVWRTRGHYVLCVLVVATPLLFLAGFCYPVSLEDLTVYPIRPIDLLEENYFIFSALFLLLGIGGWANEQYSFAVKPTELKKIALVYGLYFICLFFAWFVTCNAFRFGTLVQTAYFLMNEEDMDYLERNDFFAYGFVLEEEDSLVEKIDFAQREALFKKYRAKEDHFLQLRYDTTIRSNLLNRSYRPDLSYRSYLSYLSYRSSLLSLLDVSYLSDLLYRSYRSYQSNLLYRSSLSEKQINRLLGFQSAYMKYYHYENQGQFREDSLTTNYGITSQDTPVYQNGNQKIIFPKHPYTLEDGVRSVKHARQYIWEGIVWEVLPFVFIFTLLLCFVLFMISYLSSKNMLLSLFIVVSAIMIDNSFKLMNSLSESSDVKTLFLFAITTIVCIVYLFYRYIFFQKKKNQGHFFFIQLLLIIIVFSFLICFLEALSSTQKLFIGNEFYFFIAITTIILTSFTISRLEVRPNSE